VGYCAIIIIGFRCGEDIAECTRALSAIRTPEYAVHICENGGPASYDHLREAMSHLGREEASPFANNVTATAAVTASHSIRLHEGNARVHLHRASGNLGYAGGINAVLDLLADDPDWDGIWILNPDTQPQPDALDALRRRALSGGYGIVGSRIVLAHNQRIQMYGGRWRQWMARGFNIGLGQPADARPDVAQVEAEMEYVCGASMYVVRPFVTAVGKMEEGYFLYAEEVDWCFRRGNFKLGYAHDSVVIHDHGATIGSHHDRKSRSSFSVFLDERSKLLFTKRFFPKIFPVVVLSTLALTAQYLVAGAYKNFGVALAGWYAGLRGETGYPRRFSPKGTGAG
jgi:GT2 family glycosyltransferase